MIRNGVDLSKGIKKLVDDGALINLTQHPINIILDDTTLIINPSGTVARVDTGRDQIADGIVTTVYGDIVDLPDKVPGRLLIVSTLVRLAAPNRDDLVGPDTSPQGTVRDADGRIIGVKGIQF